MPKIAIDISPLSDGNKTRGVGYYTKNLVDSLQAEIQTNHNYKNWQINLIESSDFKIQNFDLVHYPYFDPFTLTLPPRTSTPRIVTVHDLIPIQFAKHFPVGIKGNLKWQIQRHRLKQSDYLITTSHYSKHIIKDILPYPEGQIYAIHLAADSTFHLITNKKVLKTVHDKYHLPDKFVFYLGDINWNKNIPTLVEVCTQLNYPLVISGKAATAASPIHPWTKDIHWLQEKAAQNPLIKLLGFTPDVDLSALFNLATIYCQPSYAEGFGLPVVQAMQSGCPVVYSQETSLWEIMDFCGLSFDPYQPKQLQRALTRFWNQPPLRQKYIQKGLKRAKVFNWHYTAVQTLSVYKLALINEK